MRRLSTLVLCSAIALSMGAVATQSEPLKPAVNIDQLQSPIPWLQDLDTALAQSRASGKPILALSQDVSICPSCPTILHDLSSHRLLAEAVMDEFVPLQLDRRPPTRLPSAPQAPVFLDGNGRPLFRHSPSTASTGNLAAHLTRALKAANRPVPRYLHAVAMERDTANHKQAAFAMFCYWVGEYELGKIPGVISTEAGWLEGREVTLVRYHRDQLDLPELARKAAEVKCAQQVFAPTEPERQALLTTTRLRVGTLDGRYRAAKPSDQKKQLQSWRLSDNLGLTPMQLTKLNAFAPDDRKRAIEWLSSRQRQALGARPSRRQ